jgi:septal ring factor EnvC (AmiA/AmiB activator)
MQIKTYYEIAKAAMFGLIIVALVVAGLKGYAWVNMQFAHQEAQHKIELESARQYKQYNDSLVRAHTEVVKSLKDEIRELDGRWDEARRDIKEKDEEIINIGKTIAKLDENIRDLRVKSDHAYKEGTGDYNEQYFKKIMYRHKDEKGSVTEVPVAWSIYFPNREFNKQWKTGVYLK